MTADVWRAEWLSRINCVLTQDWLDCCGFRKATTFPSSDILNTIACNYVEDFCYSFVTQKNDPDDYYENIIARHREIPTRANNWHDFLNASIWMQFPKSKAFINQLHAEDIAHLGLHPRSQRRNALTHFDECGVVLACDSSRLDDVNALIHDIATHQWQAAFMHKKALWHKVVHPFVFGHALLEMQLNPFIGMTGKWLAIAVSPDFASQTKTQQRTELDWSIQARLQHFNGLGDDNVLRPIPALGIPNWFPAQAAEFYSDTQYFRPQRDNVPLTRQYPIA